jgi:hypothetical protein
MASTKGSSSIRNYDADPDKRTAFAREQATIVDDIIVDLLGGASVTFGT